MNKRELCTGALTGSLTTTNNSESIPDLMQSLAAKKISACKIWAMTVRYGQSHLVLSKRTNKSKTPCQTTGHAASNNGAALFWFWDFFDDFFSFLKRQKERNQKSMQSKRKSTKVHSLCTGNLTVEGMNSYGETPPRKSMHAVWMSTTEEIKRQQRGDKRAWGQTSESDRWSRHVAAVIPAGGTLRRTLGVS